MLLVDSQIHLFAPGAEEFATRMQQVMMPAEDIVAAMDAAGVSRVYLVPGNAYAQICRPPDGLGRRFARMAGQPERRNRHHHH